MSHILGAWTEFNLDGNWSLAENQRFDTLSGVKMAASMHYATWTDSGIQAELQSAYNAGRSLVHCAWPAKGGRPADIVNGVISGAYDSIITTLAGHLETARAGRAMHARPFWEMNGSWQPWNASFTGNDPTKYIAMFQRFVTVARAAGYGGQFVWSPNAFSSSGNSWDTLESYYPGNSYVDIVGVSAYNHFTTSSLPWREFSLVVAGIEAVAANHNKPLCMSEGASVEDPNTSGRKAQWINNMFAYLANHSRWETVMWFHRAPNAAEPNKNWTVDSSASSLTAWQQAAAGSWPVPSLSGNIAQNVNQVFETDAPQPITRIKTTTVNKTFEVDSPLGMVPTLPPITVTVNEVSETDSVQVVVRNPKAVFVSTVEETDSTQELVTVGQKVVNVNQLSEASEVIPLANPGIVPVDVTHFGAISYTPSRPIRIQLGSKTRT